MSLAPDVVIEGDSGEIITAIHEFGIIHSPGFPGYVVLAKLFTSIVGWMDIAKATNLFSAVCGALSCYWIYRIGRLLNLRWSAVGAALILGVSAEFWYGSSAAEVYTFAILTLLWIVEAAMRFDVEKPPTAIWLGFAIGFGISAHVYSWAFAPIVAAILLRENWGKLKLKSQVLKALGAMFAGFFPYLYIPLRAGKAQFINEGAIDSVGRFFEHVTWILQRQRVGEGSDLSLSEFLTIKFQQLGYFAKELSLQWGLGGLIVVLGLCAISVRLYFKCKKSISPLEKRYFSIAVSGLISMPLVVWLLFAGDSYDLGLMAEMAVHMMTFYLFLSLFILTAVFLLAAKAKVAPANYDPRPASYIILVPIFLFTMRLGEYSLRENQIAVAHAMDLLEHLPPDSILMGDNDNDLMTTTFMKGVRGLREDVVLLNLMNGTQWNYENYRRIYPQLKWPGYARTYYGPLVPLNIDKHPVYFTSPFGVTAYLKVSGFQSKYDFVPIHGGFRLVPKGENYAAKVIEDRKQLEQRGGFLMAKVNTDIHLRDREIDVIASRADYLMHQARYLAKHGEPAEAEKAMAEALRIPTLGRTEYGRALIEQSK
jgi:hypothetical protein